MNTSALEKMNKNKELADKIMYTIEAWVDEIDLAQDDDHRIDLTAINVSDFIDLQARIERLLEE